jgi:hypothetical protein
MDGSILTDIKGLLGIAENVTSFDREVTIDINTTLMTVNQLGIGPVEGFSIEDAAAKWSDLLGAENKKQEAVKTYIYLKVRLVFDPPASAFVVDAIEKQAADYEWRLSNQI